MARIFFISFFKTLAEILAKIPCLEHRGAYMPPLVKQETLAESFYYVSYGSSIIMSKVCQIISVMKT